MAIIGIIVLLAIISGVLYYTYKGTKISFKKTMGSLQLAIVVLYNNGKHFNFVVDTGSTNSVISKNSLKDIQHTEIPTENCTLYGIDGQPRDVSYVNAVFYNGKKRFEDDFQVVDIPALDTVREIEGIEIAGFIGSSFLQKYNITLDFGKCSINIPKKLFMIITQNL